MQVIGIVLCVFATAFGIYQAVLLVKDIKQIKKNKGGKNE